MPENADILLVEDTSTQAIIMQQMLASSGYTVDISKSAEDALIYLQTKKPRFLLTDINLPEMDGYELSRQIKADAGWKGITVVLLVALKDREEFIEIVNSKADNFMMKLLKRDYFLPAFEKVKQFADKQSESSSQARVEHSDENSSHELSVCPQTIFNMLGTCFETIISQQRQLAEIPGRSR
jgi:CheY-like chemotaxis protein